MGTTKLEEIIKANEGFSRTAYKCTAGKLTVGYGHNLEDTGLSPDEALYLLRNQLGKIRDALDGLGLLSPGHPSNQEIVLFDMAFNMGLSGLLKFKKMLAAYHIADYETAAVEILDSAYGRGDTRRRAERNAVLMRGRE